MHGGLRPTIHLQLLGGFSLVINGDRAECGVREERLLALLALRGTQTRRFLAGNLWPDTTEVRASASLRSTLMQVRRLHGEVIASTHRSIGLDPQVSVDIEELRSRLHPLELHGPDVWDWGAACLNGYIEVDLLPGWDDDWVVAERELLHHRRVMALKSVCLRALEDHRGIQAEILASQLIRFDPLMESAHALLIRAHLTEGDRAAALQVYRDYSRRLSTELNVKPSSSLTDLMTGAGFVVRRSE